MIRAVVNGALGHMGKILTDLLESSDNFVIAAKADRDSHGNGVFTSLSGFDGEADVVIDFSHHTSAPEIADWAVKHSAAVVIATTGHTDEEKKIIEEASASVPVFCSANMSMGVALLCSLAKKAAAAFPGADIEIVECHHNRKQDAPSGTALMLAESVRQVRPGAEIVCGRSGMGGRGENEIGISSLRLGNMPGTHEVIVNTGSQSISLRHEVYDRSLFAEGAMEAARFIAGKPAGLYGMEDIFHD